MRPRRAGNTSVAVIASVISRVGDSMEILADGGKAVDHSESNRRRQSDLPAPKNPANTAAF